MEKEGHGQEALKKEILLVIKKGLNKDEKNRKKKFAQLKGNGPLPKKGSEKGRRKKGLKRKKRTIRGIHQKRV